MRSRQQRREDRQQRKEARQKKAEIKALQKQENKFLKAYDRAVRKHANSIKKDPDFINKTKLPDSVTREMEKFLTAGPIVSDMRKNGFGRIDSMLDKIKDINDKYLPATSGDFNLYFAQKSAKDSLLNSVSLPINLAKIEVAPTQPSPTVASPAPTESRDAGPTTLPPIPEPPRPKVDFGAPPPSLQDIVDNLPEIPTAPTQENTAEQDAAPAAPSEPEPEIGQSAEQLNAQIMELDAQIKELISAADEAAISGDFEKAGEIIDQREILEAQLQAAVDSRNKLEPEKRQTTNRVRNTDLTDKKDPKEAKITDGLNRYTQKAKQSIAIKLSGTHLEGKNKKKFDKISKAKNVSNLTEKIDDIYNKQISDNKKQLEVLEKKLKKADAQGADVIPILNELLNLSEITSKLEQAGSLANNIELVTDFAEYSKELEEKARAKAESDAELEIKPEAKKPEPEQASEAAPTESSPQKSGVSPEQIQEAKKTLQSWMSDGAAKQADHAPRQEAPEPEAQTLRGPGK